MRATDSWRLLGLCAGLLAAPPAAIAQTPAAPAKIAVPLGPTGLVDNPCPPQPVPPLKASAEAGKAPVSVPDAMAAYQAYGTWRQANDWADLCHYRELNRALAGAPRPRVVFMGDSITELWRLYDPGFFSDGVVDRGISGQTTPQMVVRFYADVVRLRPRAVHIMAGTNDIAGNTGPSSDAQFKANITAMADLARANGIKLIVASIPPTKRFSWRPELKPADKVRELNAWLKAFAASRGGTYVDYYTPMADADGGMKPEFTSDGVHPLGSGYGVMKTRAERAMAQALGPRR